jgi:multimeric flavodoxin WrbA
VINSDRVFFASPVIMGYLSAVMKKFMDKLTPLIHPYLTIDQGEAHHKHRYLPLRLSSGCAAVGKNTGHG